MECFGDIEKVMGSYEAPEKVMENYRKMMVCVGSGNIFVNY